MVKIIDIMKKLNPDEVDCLKKEFQEKNKIISELEYKLSEKFKNCYWCEKSDELIRLQEKYEYLEGWHDAVLKESSEYESKIAELEAKLAESEKTEDGAFWFEKWQHKKRDYDSVYKAYIENCAEVDQLKQQLADKEKEETKRMEDFEKGCQEYYKSNQRVIDELEKVKEIFGRVRWYQGSCNLGFGEAKCFDDKLVSWIDVEKEIDQQIKELKGEK